MSVAELIQSLTKYMKDWGNVPVVIKSGDNSHHLPVNQIAYFPKSFISYPGKDDKVEAPVIELASTGFDLNGTVDAPKGE